MPLRTKSNFNFMSLGNAVFNVRQALNDPSLDQGAREALSNWWEQRKRQVVNELQSRLQDGSSRSAQILPSRLWLGLGIYLLNQDHPLGKQCLETDLPVFVRKLGNDVSSQAANMTSGRQSAQSGNSLDILAEQIKGFEELEGMARELGYFLRKPQDFGITPGEEFQRAWVYLEEINQCVTDIQQNLGNLDSLREVVQFVDDKLPAAYLENDQQQWTAIQIRLQGNRDIANQVPWVPSNLKTHVSLNWIRAAHDTLKEDRDKLEDAMNQILWAVQYEGLESSSNTPPARQSSEVELLREKQWAENFIAQSRQNRQPLASKSLIEHAADKYRFVLDHAEISDYSKYTAGARDALKRKITRQVENLAVWHINPDLDQALQTRCDRLKHLRASLLPLIGGELKDGREAPAYAAWTRVFCDACKGAKKGDFETAQQICTDELDSSKQDGLQARINELDQIIAQTRQQSDLAGMVKWLLEAAQQRRAQLMQESNHITSLKEKVQWLQGEYVQSQENATSYLKQIFQISENPRLSWPLFGPRLQKKQDDYVSRCKIYLTQCWRICPDAPWVASTAQAISCDLSGSPSLSDWTKAHLPDVDQPNEGC